MGSNQSTDSQSVSISSSNIEQPEPILRHSQSVTNSPSRSRRFSFHRRRTASDIEAQPRGSLSSELGTLVIVKTESKPVNPSNDPIQLRLNGLPTFNPIIQNPDKLDWSREGIQIHKKIDSNPVLAISSMVQTQFREEAERISKEQCRLSLQIRTIDVIVKNTVKLYFERQKQFAKHAENLSRVPHFAHLLAKCQGLMDNCKRTCKLLNQLLPEADRIEPFNWGNETHLIPVQIP